MTDIILLMKKLRLSGVDDCKTRPMPHSHGEPKQTFQLQRCSFHYTKMPPICWKSSLVNNIISLCKGCIVLFSGKRKQSQIHRPPFKHSHHWQWVIINLATYVLKVRNVIFLLVLFIYT